LIERVIENWLTSANERQYQIPFCQVLESEGESLIHISTHGPFELGKDIITIGLDKVPRVYQLKGGNVGMGEWRQFKTELDQLVEYEIDNPEIKTRKRHIPFFCDERERERCCKECHPRCEQKLDTKWCQAA
jgi:hypothetical protein